MQPLSLELLPLLIGGFKWQAESRSRHLELVLALLRLCDRQDSILRAAAHIKLNGVHVSANHGDKSAMRWRRTVTLRDGPFQHFAPRV